MKIKGMSFKIMTVLLFVVPWFSGTLKNRIFGIIFLIAALRVLNNLSAKRYKVRISNQSVESRLYISLLLVIGYSALNFVINDATGEALERFFQLIVSLVVLLAAYQYKWSYSDYKFLFFVIKSIVASCLIMWPLSGFTMNYYSAMFTRGNTLAPALFCYLCLLLMGIRKFTWSDKLTIGALVFLLYISNSRSVIMAVLVYLLCRMVLTKFAFNYKPLLLIAVSLGVLLPVGYLILFYSPLKAALDAFSWAYFRKRFFSGRQTIWAAIFAYIVRRPFIGYGMDVTPESLLGMEWSAHNWYLQVFLQMGICGFLVQVNILRNIWDTLYVLRTNAICKNTAAFMIGVMIWQTFEVALTQNNFSVGIMVWFVWGLGLAGRRFDLDYGADIHAALLCKEDIL